MSHLVVWIVDLVERVYLSPRERELGRTLTTKERLIVGLVVTSPLWLFVIVCIVRAILLGTHGPRLLSAST